MPHDDWLFYWVTNWGYSRLCRLEVVKRLKLIYLLQTTTQNIQQTYFTLQPSLALNLYFLAFLLWQLQLLAVPASKHFAKIHLHCTFWPDRPINMSKLNLQESQVFQGWMEFLLFRLPLCLQIQRNPGQ